MGGVHAGWKRVVARQVLEGFDGADAGYLDRGFVDAVEPEPG